MRRVLRLLLLTVLLMSTSAALAQPGSQWPGVDPKKKILATHPDGEPVGTDNPLPVAAGAAGFDVNVTQLGGNAISLGAGAAAAGTQRFISAANDPGVTLLGTIDADTGAMAAAIAALGAALPASGIAVGLSDGVNLQVPLLVDGDTGAGTEWWGGFVPVIPDAGGAVIIAHGAGNVTVGTQRVTLAGDDPVGGATGLDGAAAPTRTLQVGGFDGANLQALSTDAAGQLQVVADTELPAAAALGDALANPTVPGVGGFLLGWENGGGVWERVRSNAGRLEVDLELVSGAQLTLGQAVMASSLPVAIASDQSDVPCSTELATDDLDTGGGVDTQGIVGLALPAAGGHVLVGAGAAGDPIPISDDGGAITVDGSVTVGAALPAGGNEIGGVDVTKIGGTAVLDGAGNTASGAIRVVKASHATGADDHITVGAGAEQQVLAASAGRRFARVQVGLDTDGPICCVAGATTNNCADGIYLDPGTASSAGGSADFPDYSGAITCRSTSGDVTTAVQSW